MPVAAHLDSSTLCVNNVPSISSVGTWLKCHKNEGRDEIAVKLEGKLGGSRESTHLPEREGGRVAGGSSVGEEVVAGDTDILERFALEIPKRKRCE